MQREKTVEKLHCGLHISGASSNRTSLVILEQAIHSQPVTVKEVYKKIGPIGSLFSDDRLFDILGHLSGVSTVFVDCPLSLPPCGACKREVCPGVWKCDDLSVAYLMHTSGLLYKESKKKRKKINPQSQRLWDVLHMMDPVMEPYDVTYSQNLSPLVTRVQTLQKRLNSLDDKIILRESFVPAAISVLAKKLNLDIDSVGLKYRNFELGQEVRRSIVKKMIVEGWLAVSDYEDIVSSIDVFSAFIVALVNFFYANGQTKKMPEGYPDPKGWVYLPVE